MFASDDEKESWAEGPEATGDRPRPGSRLARLLAVDNPVEAYLLSRELVVEILTEDGQPPASSLHNDLEG